MNGISSAGRFSQRRVALLQTVLVQLVVAAPGLADSEIDLGRGPVTIHVPKSYDPAAPAPLTILLHRFGSSGTVVESFFGFEALSEEHGVIYAAPDGTINPNGVSFWNATNACCNYFGSPVDDSGYLRSLIEAIQVEYNIDGRRIYIAGLSNGAFMTHRMACEHADLIAAVVAVAGDTYANPTDCSPAEPVHVLQIHGTSDGVIPYDGGNVGLGSFPSAETSVATWAQYNDCDFPPTPTKRMLDLDRNLAGSETSVLSYAAGCRVGGSAQLWTVANGVHVLAPSVDFGPAVLDFLLTHSRLAPRYLVSSHSQHSIREYDGQGNFLADFVEPGAGGLTQPQQMAYGPDGHLYVSSFDGGRVLRFHGATGKPLGEAASGFGLQGPTHLSFDPGGAMVVSWFGSGRVVRHDPATNTELGDVIDPSAANSVHGRLQYELAGENFLLVAVWTQNTVMRFREDGTKESDFLTAGDNLNQPASLALDPAGDAFWVSNFGNGSVRRFSLSTGDPIPPHILGLTNPDGLFVDNDDSLLVSIWGMNEVRRYDTATGALIEVLAGGADALQQPNGIIRKLDAGDCNGNGIGDLADINDETSADCNDNLLPDECEDDPDCNQNGVLDSCDLSSGASNDCNLNQVPDECDPTTDCNSNGVQDICDVAAGDGTDCNGNQLLDECEPDDDCNDNSVQDICDIAGGGSTDFNGNNVPDDCEPARTIHVDDDAPKDPGPGDSAVSDPLEDGTLEHPFDAIQRAIDDSIPNDRIVVADGVYRGHGNRDLDFGGRGIELSSENGPAACILNCEGSSAEPHRGMYFHTSETASAVVAGFTITNGYVTNGAPGGAGGGAILIDSAAPTVRDCTFIGNTAESGGAVSIVFEGSATISDCRFTDNEAMFGGGVEVGDGALPFIAGCTFEGNSATLGGGIFNRDDAGPTIGECMLARNVATLGGGMYSIESASTAVNCLFADNSAATGGGMYNNGSDSVVANCTFGGGSVSLGSSIYSSVGSATEVNNCILWNTGGEEVTNVSNSTTSVRYSDVRSGYKGKGNIDLDPKFIDGDFRLTPSSPCIDSGDGTALASNVVTDLSGQPRFADVPCVSDTGVTPDGMGTIDMGAYEVVDSDCNENDVSDVCELADDGSNDCNGNFVLDECEPDANDDGLPDDCCLGDTSCVDADVCTVGRCIAGECAFIPIEYGDVNNDGAVDILDIFCVLDGFEGRTGQGCSLPDSDIAGGGGTCIADGAVDIFDIFAVLDAFIGIDACCGGS